MIRKSAAIRGKWFITYQTEIFHYREILTILPEMSKWLKNQKIVADLIRIDLSKKHSANNYFLEISEDNDRIRILTIKLNQVNPGVISYSRFSPLALPIKHRKKIIDILLYYPMLTGDQRWKSIGLPPSSLFLGSSLHRAGFNIKTDSLKLPYTKTTANLNDYQLLGFTLFEDTFSQTKVAIENIAANFQGLLAAGGPMVSLNPMATAYHLPEINLLVRGESELILPGILKTINNGELKKLFEYDGILLNLNSAIILSGFDKVNRPENLRSVDLDLNFLEKKHFKVGLEVNFSRGCRRNCIFCAKVQGKKLRNIPVTKIDNLLKEYNNRLVHFNLNSAKTRTININDDDILQDSEYTRMVLEVIDQNNFKIWGLQTSIQSFFSSDLQLNRKLLKIIDNKEIYVQGAPLIWLGTDTFLEQRGRRLGKKIPDPASLELLVKEFEIKGIRNYHYWICSDFNSNWQEFVAEFLFIHQLLVKYKNFHIIGHAPYLVPYPSTPLYKLINKKGFLNRIIFKEHFLARDPYFSFSTVDRVVTGFENLNRLLNNEKDVAGRGFFDYLKLEDYLNVFRTLFDYLKKDRILYETNPGSDARKLKKTEKLIEAVIVKML